MQIDKLIRLIKSLIAGKFTGTIEIKFFEGGVSKVYKHQEMKG